MRKQTRPRHTGSIYRSAGSAMYYIAYLHGGRQVTESTKQSDPHVAARLLKEQLRMFLEAERHEVFDLGTDSADPVD